MSIAQLPVVPPLAPMLAKLERQLPLGDLYYEPKWDGFRCVVFRSGAEVELTSRNELSLTRYFPEVVDGVRQVLPDRVVLDGELVVAGPGGLDFDALSQRIHPAQSRVRALAASTPASFVAFDLLALGDEDLRRRPFAERRRMLEGIFDAGLAGPGAWVRLTPATVDPALAADWFERFEGAGLDGVVAKPADLPYQEGKRAMVKVKHVRTADFVVAGFRWYRSSGTASSSEVGSLLLGLYGDGAEGAPALHHVGVIGSFPSEQRRRLLGDLEPYRLSHDDLAGPAHPWSAWRELPPGDGNRRPGARSRWNASKDLSFELLRPELVVEATYEHLQGPRLRHTAHFVRWRPERAASSCTYEQLEVAVPVELSQVFAGARSHGPSWPS